MLDRPPAWPPSSAYADPDALIAELRAFASARRRARCAMPTAAELEDAGRLDLLRAVTRAGGFHAVSRKAGLVPRRGERGAGSDFGRGVAALSAYLAEQARDGGAPPAALPTHADLLRSGRHDLRYILQAREGGRGARAWAGPTGRARVGGWGAVGDRRRARLANPFPFLSLRPQKRSTATQQHGHCCGPGGGGPPPRPAAEAPRR